jgi:hypothetical protein
MEKRNFCYALQSELDEWKQRVRNHIGRFEDLPPKEKESIGPFVTELKDVIDEHTRRMARLNEKCQLELVAVRPQRGGSRWRKFWADVARHRRYRPHL